VKYRYPQCKSYGGKYIYNAIKALKEEGFEVPDDISILGLDGNEFGEFLTQSITTIKRPIREMAKIAIGELLKLLNNNKNIEHRGI